MNPFTQIARAAAATTDKHLSTISKPDTLHMIALGSMLVSVAGETKLRVRRDAVGAGIRAKLPQFSADVVESTLDAAEIEVSLNTGSAILASLGRVQDQHERSLIRMAIVAISAHGGRLCIGEQEAIDQIGTAMNLGDGRR